MVVVTGGEGGSRQGNAGGFRLKTLNKLHDGKTPDSKLTILQVGVCVPVCQRTRVCVCVCVGGGGGKQNFVNHGSRPGNAGGFRLKTLNKLHDSKTPDL
jgi:hypothetical protein